MNPTFVIFKTKEKYYIKLVGVFRIIPVLAIFVRLTHDFKESKCFF